MTPRAGTTLRARVSISERRPADTKGEEQVDKAMSTRGQFNTKSPTIRRISEQNPPRSPFLPPALSRGTKTSSRPPTNRSGLQKVREASELANSPSPDFHAAPLDTDLFEWHFTLRGPPSGAYAAGLYHGRILLPAAYPLRPPSFRFLTPSGRFEVNREICLSISGHHEETWQPAWGLRTALVALRAFMGGDAKGQVGGMDAADELREALAKESRAWVCRACGGRRNDEILPGEE
ncbi:hypothetical protein GP486_008049, partial [Trichoglossum hirsutum]